MCEALLVDVGSSILGSSKLVVLLIKRVFHLSFKETNYYRLYDIQFYEHWTKIG